MTIEITTTTRYMGEDIPSVIYSLAFRLGRGAPEAVSIVMEQIGRIDLYWAWINTRQQLDCMVEKSRAEHSEPVAFEDLLAPITDRHRKLLDEENEAWRKIEVYIEAAQAYIDAQTGIADGGSQ